MKKIKSGTIKKVLKFIGKYKYLLFLAVLFAAVSASLMLYVPILVGSAIDFIVAKDNVDFESIFAILLKVGVIVGSAALLQWLMNTVNNRITYHVVRDIRNEAFKKIEKLPLKYIDSHSYGDIVSRVITDVDTFADGLLMGFTNLFTGVVTILGTLVFFLFFTNSK